MFNQAAAKCCHFDKSTQFVAVGMARGFFSVHYFGKHIFNLSRNRIEYYFNIAFIFVLVDIGDENTDSSLSEVRYQ